MFHVCCHEGTAITFARDRRVYLMNAERQSQSASAADPPIGSYSVYIHHRHLLLSISQSVNQYSFIKGMPERRPKQFTKYNIRYNIAEYNVISSPMVECQNSEDKDKA